VWAWGAAQYPHLLAGLTARAAAAPQATLSATVICTAVGGALVLPSLAWLLALAQRPARPAAHAGLPGGRGNCRRTRSRAHGPAGGGWPD
jgi:hypothetical protein